MKLNKYFVYIDDGDAVYRLAIAARDETEAMEAARGSGEIVGVKDVTGDYPVTAEAVSNALIQGGIDGYEAKFIVRALETVGIAE